MSTRDTTRLPNSIEIASSTLADALGMVPHGASATVGFDRIALDGLTVGVVRWWDPRPRLGRISTAELEAAIRGLPTAVPDIESTPLAVALSAGSPPAILAAAESLIGSGPGLTPEGDDYLAGALSAIRILGDALGVPRATAALDSVAGALDQLACARTTTFSASLIRHAVAGRVAAPAGVLLRALAGRGDVAISHRDLLRVGHTSGPALAAGMMLGAHSLLQSQVTLQRR